MIEAGGGGGLKISSVSDWPLGFQHIGGFLLFAQTKEEYSCVKALERYPRSLLEQPMG